MKHFKYEYKKVKNQAMSLFWIAFVTLLSALYFFSFVGRFDQDESNSIISNYAGVMGISSMVTFSVIAVYGSVLSGKLIVRDYIGLNKNKTYLLPVNRKSLFDAKIFSFTAVAFISELAGLICSTVIFILSESVMRIVNDNLFKSLENFFVSIVTCVCFTIAAILISSLIGIYRESSISVIISSVILVVITSNILTRIIISFGFLSLVLSVLIIIITLLLINGMGKLIDRSDAG